MSRQWILTSQKGFEESLQYQENVDIPSQDQLNPDEVLVRIHAASLNYREILIADPNVSGEYCFWLNQKFADMLSPQKGCQ